MNEKNYNDNRTQLVGEMIRFVENGGDDGMLNLFKNGGTVYRFVEKERSKISQLRKFYDDLLSIRPEKIDRYKLLKIELNGAYAFGRNEYISRDMYKFISDSVELVLKDAGKQAERVERFKRVFEAIIAYYAFINKGTGE